MYFIFQTNTKAYLRNPEKRFKYLSYTTAHTCSISKNPGNAYHFCP